MPGPGRLANHDPPPAPLRPLAVRVTPRYRLAFHCLPLALPLTPSAPSAPTAASGIGDRTQSFIPSAHDLGTTVQTSGASSAVPAPSGVRYVCHTLAVTRCCHRQRGNGGVRPQIGARGGARFEKHCGKYGPARGSRGPWLPRPGTSSSHPAAAPACPAQTCVVKRSRRGGPASGRRDGGWRRAARYAGAGPAARQAGSHQLARVGLGYPLLWLLVEAGSVARRRSLCLGCALCVHL